jgi:hypothetical protein
MLSDNRLMAIATGARTAERRRRWSATSISSFRGTVRNLPIERHDRVSIVIGRDFHDPGTIRAVSIAARASEVRDQSSGSGL